MSVTALPFESDELAQTIADALTTVDGAGARPTMVFVFDGELEQESLPLSSPMATLAPESSVFLIDADASSPNAFERIALEVELAGDRRSIRARVAFDRPLVPGRRYAAVVTDALRSRSDRRRVGPSPLLARILDGSMPLDDAREKLARTQYLPILPALEARGIAPSHVVALSSFRVQSLERVLDEARASFDERDAAEEPRFEPAIEGEALDAALGEPPAGATGAVPGQGVHHEHIAALLHLAVRTPMFANVTPGERTAFERNDEGELVRPGAHDVPCTLIVPRSAGSSALPVILFQHGLFGERSDALPVANALAATGFGVLTCDAPLHGSRLPGSDTGHRFSGALEPDGFGDVIFSDLLGLEEGAGELPPAHPFYYRDAVQQAAVDWMAIVATLRSGAWDEPLADALGRDDVVIARDNVGFIGTDFGAEIGIAVAAREPEIATVVLAFAGGRGIDDWNGGPDYAPLREAYEGLLEGEDGDGFDPAFRGDVSALRTLLDPATGLANASRLRRSSVNVLTYIAVSDELVPLQSSEAVAYGLGEDLVDADPMFELELRRKPALPGNAENFPLARGSVTRIAQTLARATRTVLFSDGDEVRYEHPLDLPPVKLSKPRTIENPTAVVMRQIAFFFESYRACLATRTDPLIPCAASVAPLDTER